MNKIINRLKTLPRLFGILVTIIAVVGIGTSAFLYVQYQKAQNILKNPTIQGQLEAKDLEKKVSRLMLLPENEQPTIATVSDFKKIKDQPFFKNAHNGDKVLIYTKAKQAILYDPKQDKILAVAPLNIGSTSPTAADANTAPPIRVALYNGTTTAGLSNTVEQQLKAKLNNIVISQKVNAKNTYAKTKIVDLTGNQAKAASDLAALLGGEAGGLPEGESAPSNSDLLVIIGK